MKNNATPFIAFFILLQIAFFQKPLYATTYFVSQNGAGNRDGLSWGTSAPDSLLQTIINGANPGDEVWVSCGTYYTTGGNNRSISFSMKTGVSIYGSFQGTETTLNQRVFSCGYCSTLSGEIGTSNSNDNSYKVVYNQLLDSTAILDGFVIQGGFDNRSPTSAGNGLGGGMYNHGFGTGAYCHPTVRNCLFKNNLASWGSGAFNNGYNLGNSEPTYINCIFYNNHALIEAGGMDSYGVGGNASPALFNCIFYGNTSATNVGAMYAWGGNAGGNCHPVLTNCVFANNTAINGYGGAFIADNLDENGTTSSGSCTVTLKNCIVWHNTSTQAGPQFYIKGIGAQVISTFSNIDTAGQNFPHLLSGTGTGNIFTQPLLVDWLNALGADSCWLTQDDGLRLQNLSPCIDSGDSLATYGMDVSGVDRVSGTQIDMGAYEFQQPMARNFPSLNSEFLIFPNPVKDLLFIRNQATVTSEIFILNVHGVTVYQSNFTLSGNPELNTLDIEFLLPGLYFVSINGVSRMIVKE